MGSYHSNLSLIIIFCAISLSSVTIHCANDQDLDDLIRTYAARTNPRPHTGSLYKITLPANLSGVEASVVTVRNSMFWRKGANFSHFFIPPLVKTTPYAKRIALLYENFGNSSSRYFRVAGYSFVSPVVGFSAYDATNPNDMGDEKLNFSIVDNDVISIRFDSDVTHIGKDENSIRCVAFVDEKSNNNNGSIEFSNLTGNYECATRSSSGRFALVIPNQKQEKRALKLKWWWLALVAAGIFVVVTVVAVMAAKLVRKKKMREMERESEKSEAIGYVWIGRSRMPTAAMARTQPSLEHHHLHLPTD
ncbi:PREDICTED: uncharacterized protein LOC104801383 [Tarenaya hassleriana]|uniref:uncharacterized protein LOC104801383 n=1 Tax=Tarenaya hassleriana TaxID=28532 RepID=UPI00053C6078|nr:PREDICTED: uncharacterized protein LOC104801383 [Tarenaya hassleriana]